METIMYDKNNYNYWMVISIDLYLSYYQVLFYYHWDYKKKISNTGLIFFTVLNLNSIRNMIRVWMFMQFYTFVGIIREMKLKQKFNIFEYHVRSIGFEIINFLKFE